MELDARLILEEMDAEWGRGEVFSKPIRLLDEFTMNHSPTHVMRQIRKISLYRTQIQTLLDVVGGVVTQRRWAAESVAGRAIQELRGVAD